MELKELYQERMEKFQSKAEELKARYVRFSFIRLVIFIVAVGLFVLIWTQSIPLAFLFVAVFLFGFSKFVNWHQQIQKDQVHHKNLSLINANEAKVIDHDYQIYADGKEFLDTNHPNAIDLDIFGPYSIFQYINRTSTSIGKKKLADFLTQVADLTTIKERQICIAELKDKLDWRQDLQAYGVSTIDDPEHIELLNNWLNQESYLTNKPWIPLVLALSPLWFFAGIFLAFYYMSWWIGILTVAVPGLLLRQFVTRINKTHAFTTNAEKILARYGQLIGHIEKEKFQTTRLQNLQKVFVVKEKSASKSIQRLSYIIGQLNVRYNAFSIFLQIICLWDLQWVWRLEKWKKVQKEELPAWFEALEEFEALCSMANLYYNNPEWVFPTFHDQKEMDCQALGHPLIDRNKRVCNDFKSPTAGHIKLVTGSNMAGKSTFLRTVGLNTVLATSGSVVCAASMTLPLLKVYTSMRTVDALHESTSSFYAELKRLKTIIEAVDTQEDIYFLLDEILKGTNSNDRHTGSKVLIQQMIKSKGGGIIATHDLELGAMEATANGTIENLCMEVEVVDNELIFDYTLKKGVSQSFNATLLMKNMGIRIE